MVACGFFYDLKVFGLAFSEEIPWESLTSYRLQFARNIFLEINLTIQSYSPLVGDFIFFFRIHIPSSPIAI